MKRFILLIFFIVLVIVVTSCSSYKYTSSKSSFDTKDNKEVVSKSPDNPSPSTDITTKNTKDILSLIPQGWYLLERNGKEEKVEGDLNKDGIKDIAIVIEDASKKENEAPNRSLLIAFGNFDGSYKQSTIAEKAILKSDEGGVFGDPLASISIDRGSLLVSFYGGSNSRWYGSYRFRYQNNDWFLIGATTGSFNATSDEYTEESDYNLLTGDFIQKKADSTGKIVTTKGNKGKRVLLSLVDFNARESEEQYLNEIPLPDLKAVNFSTFEVNKKYFNDVKGFAELKLKLPRLDGNYDGIPEINKYFAGKEKFFYDELPLDMLREANIKVEGENDNWYRSADYKLEAVLGNIISMSADLNGGAGGVGWAGIEGDSFNLDTGKKLNLGDIFKVDKDEYMNFIYDFVSKKITSEINCEKQAGYAITYGFDDAYSGDGYKSIRDFEPNNFYITKNTLVVFYPKYVLRCGAAGPQKFEIPYESIMNMLAIDIKT